MPPQSDANVGQRADTAMLKDFAGLTSDSRKVKPGYLFAALAGSKTDGARHSTPTLQMRRFLTRVAKRLKETKNFPDALLACFRPREGFRAAMPRVRVQRKLYE